MYDSQEFLNKQGFLVTSGAEVLLYLYMIGYDHERQGDGVWARVRASWAEAQYLLPVGPFLLEFIILSTGELSPSPALQGPHIESHSIKTDCDALLGTLRETPVPQ